MPDAHATAVTRSRDLLWLGYLGLGAVVCLLYIFVAPFRGSGPVINGLGASAVVAVILGIRRHNPRARGAWLLFALGLGLFWFGDVYTYSYPKLTGAAVPFPSFGDAVYLAVYPALMGGLVFLVRRRSHGTDAPALVDSLIMSLGLSLVSATLLIAPYVHDPTLTLLPKLVSIGYPMGDIILLAAAIRLAVDTGRRTPAFFLLVASIVTLLATDFVYGLLTLHNDYHHQLWLDAGWIAFYLFWGAAALHPSMRELSDPGSRRQPRLTPLRLVLLSAACLIAPVLEVSKAVKLHNADLIALIVASVVLSGLVIGRMAGLVRQREKSVARESALRSAASQLVSAGTALDIAGAALGVVPTLVDGPAEARLCRTMGHAVAVRALGPEARMTTWTASSLLAATLRGGDDSGVVTMPGSVRRELRLTGETTSAVVIELPVGGRDDIFLLVAGDTAADADTHNALRTLASQIAVAIERAELSEEVAQRASDARLASLVQNSTDLITVLDAAGVISYQSPSVDRLLGFAADSLVGAPFAQLLREADLPRVMPRLTDVSAQARTEPEVIECRLIHADGSEREFELTITSMLEDTAVGGFVLNGRDVTERRRIERQLEEQAFHDPVTHLANRALFNERVRHAVARARREHIGLAVIFLDLDDFKVVNDSLGHAAGDMLLVEVAKRLSASIRAVDTAARFGGDEFAILLEDVPHPQVAAETAERILEQLGRPVSLEQQDVVVRGSLGISIAPPDTPTDAEELVRNADAAMYIAKAEGKAAYRMFEPRMHEHVLARLELRADLERALDRGEFELYYQPVVRLSDKKITGVEALLRWHHPVRGLVPPDEFIPFAEETGLIVPIGHWVLHEGCRQARRLRDQTPSGVEPPSVSVNLSVTQLFHSDIIEDVRAAMAAVHLPAGALTLEITETVMMTDTDLAVERLTELRKLGVRLAMDDFGTGYSSLSYLSRFPLDILKMDRSLLAAGASPVTNGLATAVLGLGETFDLTVVAEGIEYDEQSSTLSELGCELGQGFLFARPMVAGDLDGYLENGGAVAVESLSATGDR